MVNNLHPNRWKQAGCTGSKKEADSMSDLAKKDPLLALDTSYMVLSKPDYGHILFTDTIIYRLSG